MLKLWINTQRSQYAEYGFSHGNPYLFAGIAREEDKEKGIEPKHIGKLNGQVQIERNRMNQLLKSFLARPENEDIRFHPAHVTHRGGKDSVKVVFYDIRQTSISHYIERRGDKVATMHLAEMCGVSTATLEKYYLFNDYKRNADRWVGYNTSSIDDSEGARKKAKALDALSDQIAKVKNEVFEKASETEDS
jgi:hypothetical protein